MAILFMNYRIMMNLSTEDNFSLSILPCVWSWIVFVVLVIMSLLIINNNVQTYNPKTVELESIS